MEEVVSAFEQSVKKELTRAHLEARIEHIRETPGVDVFALDETMVARLIELGAAGPFLGALDEAVLAAVLERARALRATGASEIIFCETDGDLLPWSRKKGKQPKEPISSFYREVGIEVVEGFVLD